MAKKKEASFESLLQETEKIIDDLANDTLPLDEALRKYEKGVANLHACAKMLQAAEEKVKVLVEAANGALQLEDFAEEDDDTDDECTGDDETEEDEDNADNDE